MSFFASRPGDHDIWTTPQGTLIVVPVSIKSRHATNGILKEAGLFKAF